MALLDCSTVPLSLSEDQRRHIEWLKSSGFFVFSDRRPCLSCGGGAFDTVCTVDRYGFDLSYVACRDCGFVFANPYYTGSCLEDFYNNHYNKIYGRSERYRDLFFSQFTLGRSILRWIGSHGLGRRFVSAMDYGCSVGGTVAAFPEEWRRVGYDFDPAQLAFGRVRGLDLRDAADFSHDLDMYDLISLNQVLEHIPDPIRMLERLARRLKPEGVVYIEVPGLAGNGVRQHDIRLAFKNCHCHLFTAASLTRIAAKAGLEPIAVTEQVAGLFRHRREECALPAPEEPLRMIAALAKRSRFEIRARNILDRVGRRVRDRALFRTDRRDALRALAKGA